MNKIITLAFFIPFYTIFAQGCPVDGSTITITSSTTFPAGCHTKKVRIVIPSNTSNIVVDGNGMELNGLNQSSPNDVNVPYNVGEEPLENGIELQPKTSNITIKNFVIRNYRFGVNLVMDNTYTDVFETRWETGENNLALKSEYQGYATNTNKILNNSFYNIHGTAINLNWFTHHNLVQGNLIVNSFYSGIYIYPYASDNQIYSNRIWDSGYYQYSLTSRTITNSSFKREAIAIDGSDHNDIFNNIFTNNAGGGVFLYKNCRERFDDPTVKHMPRENPSDYNTIRRNDFFNQPKGINVASRNDMIYRYKCGDPTMYEYHPAPTDIIGQAYVAAFRKYVQTDDYPYNDTMQYPLFYRDYARNNTIDGNLFRTNTLAIKIQDDNNTVTNNTFIGEGYEEHILIGAPVRKKALNLPVSGVIINSNSYLNQATTNEKTDEVFDISKIIQAN